MAFSYNKSTVREIINDALADVNEDTRTAQLAPETVQMWILDAEKNICDSVEVRERWLLGLNTNQINYKFRDRAAITGATNATPIVVTSASHGLADDDFIVIQGVGGNTAANGRFQVKNKTTNTFEIKQYATVVDATNATPINIETSEEHGFTTGDSIVVADVAGNTAANGTWAITVVDALNFTLDTSVGTAAYTSGGTATKQSVGSGTYTAGGRFWKDDELPTYFKRMIAGERLWSEVKRQVKPVDLQELLAVERQNTGMFVAFTSYDSPFCMAEWIDLGERFLKFYPAPVDDEVATLYGRIKITPRLYQSDALTTNIHLTTDYDEAIKYFVKYRIHKWLKDDKNAAECYQLYDNELSRLRTAFPRNLTQIMTYF